jgi:hypothetical protein
MTRRSSMFHRHKHVITATEVGPMGSTGVVGQVLRCQSLNDLVAHFSRQSVPANVLEVVRRSAEFNWHGYAGCVSLRLTLIRALRPRKLKTASAPLGNQRLRLPS